MASSYEMFNPLNGSSTSGCLSPCKPGLADSTRSTLTAEPPSYTSLSLFGTRKLLFWEEGVAQPRVMILREGDVYISSPAAFEHQVLHQDDPASGEELLQFGGMGLVKLAIQLRCDTFALNLGRSPPASPKHALKAASEAVQRWLMKVPLALPTLEEAQAELV